MEQAGELGDLAEGELRLVAEQEHLALVFGEAVDVGAEPVGLLGLVEAVVGGWRLVGEAVPEREPLLVVRRSRLATSSGCGGGRGRRCGRSASSTPATAPAACRRPAAAASPAITRRKVSWKRVLGDGPIAHHPDEVAEDPLLVPLHQHPERLLVAAFEVRRYQVLVGEVMHVGLLGPAPFPLSP